MAILQSGYRDASGTNASSRSVRLYKDLALSFEKNANTKDVLQKKDVDAVKQSVRNLILTNHYERPFHPEIGSGVSNLLFEQIDPITANALTRTIGEVIENFEPRARVVSIDARPNLAANSYEVTISFRVINIPGELVTLDVMLERSRYMSDKRIDVTIDFDDIKKSKNVLKQQDQFTDYDFTGSGMNTLLDVLAYNTHYNAVWQCSNKRNVFR